MCVCVLNANNSHSKSVVSPTMVNHQMKPTGHQRLHGICCTLQGVITPSRPSRNAFCFLQRDHRDTTYLLRSRRQRQGCCGGWIRLKNDAFNVYVRVVPRRVAPIDTIASCLVRGLTIVVNYIIVSRAQTLLLLYCDTVFSTRNAYHRSPRSRHQIRRQLQ